jgi:chemotaxis protein MotA
MMLEGVISILEGMNPRMIETKLCSYLSEMPTPESELEKEKEKEREVAV